MNPKLVSMFPFDVVFILAIFIFLFNFFLYFVIILFLLIFLCLKQMNKAWYNKKQAPDICSS